MVMSRSRQMIVICRIWIIIIIYIDCYVWWLLIIILIIRYWLKRHSLIHHWILLPLWMIFHWLSFHLPCLICHWFWLHHPLLIFHCLLIYWHPLIKKVYHLWWNINTLISYSCCLLYSSHIFLSCSDFNYLNLRIYLFHLKIKSRKFIIYLFSFTFFK